MRETPNAMSRLAGLDLARYVALFGMVIVNFKIAMGAENGTGLLSHLTILLEGRAAATFVVLAGIGLGLSSNKAMSRGVTLKRAAFLLVIGLLNMTIFDADILHYYAFYFLFGVLLLGQSNQALIGIIIALNCAFLGMILALDYDVGWNWVDYTYEGFWTPTGFIRNLFFNGWHPVVPWLGFLLFGIVLSRLQLQSTKTQWTLTIGGLAALIGAELISKALTPSLREIDPELVNLVTTAPVPPAALYTIAGMGAACFVVGACLAMSRSISKLGILQVVAPAGRQTLTLYVAHILIGMGLLEAMDMLGGQTIETAVSASVGFCAFATVFAWVWSRYFARGPVETVMRKLAG